MALQTRIRAWMPDEMLPWFDAAVTLTSGTAQYPPLLGTGGNDGRLDFTNNFMQRLLDVLTGDSKSQERSRKWLAMALFAQPAPGLVKSAIGQFSPGQVGGPNATNGFEADSLINPWDFVFMIEGAMAFAAAVVRRQADDPAGVLSCPFTVRSVGAGSGAVGATDDSSSRGDLWMPLWGSPAAYSEVQMLMSEGRVALGRKPARDALDFVRAVHRLGAYRGIRGFQRFGLFMRSGKAYLAIPLGRIQIGEQPASRWLDELDHQGWLERFRAFSKGSNAAARFHMLRKRLEDYLFDFSGREPRAEETQSLLILLGEIQMTLAHSSKAMESVPPVPRLSYRWVTAADDGTPAFRIAKALAGLGSVGDEVLPMRSQLFPVERRANRWVTGGAEEGLRMYTGLKGRLCESLIAILERRMWMASVLGYRDKPLAGPSGVDLGDLNAFLQDGRMDVQIQKLLLGLSLCEIPADATQTAGGSVLPAAFSLLKLAFTPDRLLRQIGRLGMKESVPEPKGVVEQLAAGNRANRAVKAAWRRLHASNLSPVFPATNIPNLTGLDPRRSAAALLIPLRLDATARLARQVLDPTSIERNIVEVNPIV